MQISIKSSVALPLQFNAELNVIFFSMPSLSHIELINFYPTKRNPGIVAEIKMPEE